MKNKHVVILVIATNIVTVGLVLLFINSGNRKQKEPATTHIPDKQLNQLQQTQEKPKQTTKKQIDSLISQYDVIKSGRYREFMDTYKRAMRKDPPYTISPTVGYTYAELGDYSRAIKLCEEELQRASYPAQFYTLAWIYAKTGKYEKAIEVSKQTIQRHPRYCEIWNILGWIYAGQGEKDKAIDACNNALKLDPDSTWAHYGLGRIYAMLGDSEKAIESYERAIQLKSDVAEIYLFLGLTYAKLSDHKKAIDSYSHAILLSKYYPEPRFFLGVSYDESSQYKKAIESFEQAITWYNTEQAKIRIKNLGITPDIATIHCIIGICHLRLGQELEASFDFKDAIKIDNSHPGAHYGLAIAYFLLDEKDAAVKEYEAVKALKGEEMTKPLFDIINKNGNLEK